MFLILDLSVITSQYAARSQHTDKLMSFIQVMIAAGVLLEFVMFGKCFQLICLHKGLRSCNSRVHYSFAVFSRVVSRSALKS